MRKGLGASRLAVKPEFRSTPPPRALLAAPSRPPHRKASFAVVRAGFIPNSEIRTAAFADFADAKCVSFVALASDSSAGFVSMLLFIRASRVSCGFNSGFRVYLNCR